MKVFLLLICVFLSAYAQEPCMLDIEDISKSPIFKPLVYDANGKMMDVQGGKIRLVHGAKATLSCQNNNFKLFPNLNNLTVECKDDNLWLDFDKRNHKFKEMSCDIRVIEEVKHRLDHCDKSGIYFQYFDNKQSKFVKLLETCYDYEDEKINFAHTTLDKNFEVDPKYQHTENLQSNTNVHHRIELLGAYRADKTAKTLKTLLGENSPIVNELLMTVRLFPRMFFNAQLQDVEKFPTNAVAMWRTVSEGNWKKVMKSIKDLAEHREKPLELYLGTSGTVVLPNEESGDPKKINLSDNKVPIPMYVWTIVSDPAKDQAVAIVTINNPFLNPAELKQQTFCESQCGDISWLKKLTKNDNHERVMFGFTFCCKVRDFKLFPSLRAGSLLKV